MLTDIVVATAADIPAQVRGILAEYLGIATDTINDDARLHDDLGADSLDVIEIAMACEEAFGIAEISDKEARGLVTVRDVVEYLGKRVSA